MHSRIYCLKEKNRNLLFVWPKRMLMLMLKEKKKWQNALVGFPFFVASFYNHHLLISNALRGFLQRWLGPECAGF